MKPGALIGNDKDHRFMQQGGLRELISNKKEELEENHSTCCGAPVKVKSTGHIEKDEFTFFVTCSGCEKALEIKTKIEEERMVN